MSIGQRIQVKLVQIATIVTATGRNQESEGDRYGVWAEVSQGSGFRNYQSGQTQLGNTKEFKIRFRFDKYPDVNWKISYLGKDWTITTIDREKNKRFYWRITATAKNDK